MCNIWKKDSPERELDKHEIERVFRNNKFSWISITGGEPFLKDDLFGFLEAVIKNSKRLQALHFNTNGTLTDRVIETMKFLRKDYPYISTNVNVSIDGYPQLHDEIRGVKGAWDKAVNTFIKLKQMTGVTTRVGFTLSEDNIRSFTETFWALKNAYNDLTFDDIFVNIFQKSAFCYSNTEIPEMEKTKLLEAIGQIMSMDKGKISINSILRRKHLDLYGQYLKTGMSPVKCQAFSATCFLDPYGNVYPCSKYDRKFVNLRETSQDFSALWQSREAKQIHYDCSHNLCPSCWNTCDANSAMGGSLIKTFLVPKRGSIL